MKKDDLEAFAREAAKGLKTQVEWQARHFPPRLSR